VLNVVRCCLASAHYVIHRHESHAVAWYRGQRERHGEAPVALAALVAASRVQRGMEGRRAHARCCDAPLGDRRWVGAHPDRDAALRNPGASDRRRSLEQPYRAEHARPIGPRGECGQRDGRRFGPRLWRDEPTLTIIPPKVLRTFADAMVFLLTVPLAEGFEQLQNIGVLPVLLRLP